MSPRGVAQSIECQKSASLPDFTSVDFSFCRLTVEFCSQFCESVCRVSTAIPVFPPNNPSPLNEAREGERVMLRFQGGSAAPASDLEALLPPTREQVGKLRRRRAAFCCITFFLFLAFVAWVAHNALDEALQLVCLSLRLVSVNVESLCANPVLVRAVIQTSSASPMSISFADLALGIRLDPTSPVHALTARVAGTHQISL